MKICNGKLVQEKYFPTGTFDLTRHDSNEHSTMFLFHRWPYYPSACSHHCSYIYIHSVADCWALSCIGRSRRHPLSELRPATKTANHSYPKEVDGDKDLSVQSTWRLGVFVSVHFTNHRSETIHLVFNESEFPFKSSVTTCLEVIASWELQSDEAEANHSPQLRWSPEG